MGDSVFVSVFVTLSKVIPLSDNLDPDDYIRKFGKDKFLEQLKNAYNVMEFKELLLKKNINFNNTEDINNYITEMIKEINNIDDDILRELTINKLVEETKINKDLILKKINPLNKKEEIIIKPKIKKSNKYEKSVQSLLYYMLKESEVIKLYDKKITHIENDDYRHLAFQISASTKMLLTLYPSMCRLTVLKFLMIL